MPVVTLHPAGHPARRARAQDSLTAARAEYDRLTEQSPSIDDAVIAQFRRLFVVHFIEDIIIPVLYSLYIKAREGAATSTRPGRGGACPGGPRCSRRS